MLFLFVQPISGQGSRCGLLHDVQYKNIARFSNHREKQPVTSILKVQAAFDREGSLKIIFQTTFDIQFHWVHEPSYVCLPLNEHIALRQKPSRLPPQ